MSTTSFKSRPVWEMRLHFAQGLASICEASMHPIEFARVWVDRDTREGARDLD